MDRISYILGRMPQFYDKLDQTSVLYTVIKAIADEIAVNDVQIDRIVAGMGVDTTLDDDLYNRWGALFGVERLSGETESIYRNKVKMAISTVVGGTSNALKYSVAVAIGISGDPLVVDSRISIIDAWEYEGVLVPPDISYGNAMCIIDMNGVDMTDAVYNLILENIEHAKAAGVTIILYFTNLLVSTYYDLSYMTYDNLKLYSYDDLITI